MASSTIASTSLGKVTIIGSGLIGRSWSALFARRGYDVCLYDTVSSQLEVARSVLDTLLVQWGDEDWLKEGENAQTVLARIRYSDSLAESLNKAVYVQECVPENVQLKESVFKQIDELVGDDTILASSTSCIIPSKFTKGLKHESMCIVAHPVNPPYYCTLVEVVPSPWTTPETVKKTIAIQKEIGQSPILVRREVNGFVLNRIQYAILMECWRLVEEGVCSPEDADIALTEGIGMRYAFMGNFETMQLNANGAVDYCQKYGDNIKKICLEQQELGARDLSGPTLDKVSQYLNSKIPIDKLEERRAWRDDWLKAIAKEKIKRKDMALQNL
ncbi:Lambda-crystallin-like isoform X1 [Oopsacas minuta]|uniref:Lambda-crystallin-like isoform X1 n=1 Tax=Oopsacas minuta TaxID=111878 RepID=A0AAV7KIU7_9METZ|nr:Lambda-crystallin-like isoform X1 [Oopsacas minuta]